MSSSAQWEDSVRSSLRSAERLFAAQLAARRAVFAGRIGFALDFCDIHLPNLA
jgi:hypothetical protein